MTRSHHPDLLAALPEYSRRNILFASEQLQSRGFEAYLVGGSVRDLMMGRAAGDLDLTTNARPEEVQKIFRRTIPTGLQHGTITVLLPEDKSTVNDQNPTQHIEVTTYRAESEYSDARHPDRIEYAERLEDDLGRRDFTVNALAYNAQNGELIDLFGGIEDIRAKLLRTIGRPEERFFEDGLRPIRACRFSATLGFDIEATTEMALRSTAVQARTNQVAIERFSDELWKGFRAPGVARMIQRLEASGLLTLFFPGQLIPTDENTLGLLDGLDPQAPVLRMAAWWQALGFQGERAKDLGRRLKYSNKQIRDIEWFQNYFDFQKNPLAQARPVLHVHAGESLLAARAFLSRLKDVYRDESAHFINTCRSYPTEIDWTSDKLLAILNTDPLTVRDLALNGSDLMKQGMSGPAIGENLRWLLELVLREPARNTKEQLLAALDSRGHRQE